MTDFTTLFTKLIKGAIDGLIGESTSPSGRYSRRPSMPDAIQHSTTAVIEPISARRENDAGVIEHPSFYLGGTAGCEAAIKALSSWIDTNDQFPEVQITTDPNGNGHYFVLTQRGERIGRLTPKHKIAQELGKGQSVLYALVNSADVENGKASARIRVATGPRGAKVHVPQIQRRWYPLGLVGEQNYQAVIERCKPGMPVEVLLEPSNPHDRRAIVVALPGGGTLGYVPKDSWLQRAVHDEGNGVRARILSADRGQRGFSEIVIEVSLNGKSLSKREFSRT